MNLGHFMRTRTETSFREMATYWITKEAEGWSESLRSQIDGHCRVGRQGCHCLPLGSSWWNSDCTVLQELPGTADTS
ncbi:hypothetical protein TNCV_4918311 [Trichonephila clavipes]|nr:hypothetical protein TNCV_4918311 [Trichonephila clavipes]